MFKCIKIYKVFFDKNSMNSWVNFKKQKSIWSLLKSMWLRWNPDDKSEYDMNILQKVQKLFIL